MPDKDITPAIQFQGVGKRFGDNVVLDGLNFTVAKGDRVTLIGPSGSGKTTILRLLMTLEEANEGLILVDGQPYTHEIRGGKRVAISEKRRSLVRRRVGMVFQQFNLFPNMTVLENIIEAPIHVLGKSRAEAVAKAEDLLDQLRVQGAGHLVEQHHVGVHCERTGDRHPLLLAAG